MLQQSTECEPQDNMQPDNQVNTSDEVIEETPSPVEEKENGTKDTKSESPQSTTEGELEGEWNSNNEEDTASDPPSTRSKSLRQSSKKRSFKKDKDTDPAESKMDSESKNDVGISITEINEDEGTLNSEVTEIEEDVHIIVDEPEETNALDTSDESEHVEFNEVTEEEEEEKSENTQEVLVEEEISVTASVYEEPSDNRHSEGSEKYSFSISDYEFSSFKSRFNGKEKDYEEPVSSENISFSGSSWGGSIRSVSARRPVRRNCLSIRERSSVSTDRPGTDENHSDTDCSIETKEGSKFSSLKRKTCDNDTVSLKKRRINDSKNSKFFSMVSTPLRLLRNKISDRIVESTNAHEAEDVANGNNDDFDDDNESVDRKMKEETPEVKEKTHGFIASKMNNQNFSLSQSWCNVM